MTNLAPLDPGSYQATGIDPATLNEATIPQNLVNVSPDQLSKAVASLSGNVQQMAAEGLIPQSVAQEALALLTPAKITDLKSLLKVEVQLTQLLGGSLGSSPIVGDMLDRAFKAMGMTDTKMYTNLTNWVQSAASTQTAYQNLVQATNDWFNAPSAETAVAMLQSQQAYILAEQQEADTMKAFIDSWFDNLEATKDSIIAEGNLKAQLAYDQANAILISSIASAGISLYATYSSMKNKPEKTDGMTDEQYTAKVREWSTTAEAKQSFGSMGSSLVKGFGDAAQKYLEAQFDPKIAGQQAIQTMRKAVMDSFLAMLNRAFDNFSKQREMASKNMEDEKKMVDASTAMFRG